MNIKLCKIQKATNFTHFIPKIFHINPSKTMNIYTFATVYIIILLISHFAPFFSLFSMQNKLTSPLHIVFFLRYTQTQTHPHPNTSTQTNQHRDTQTQTQTHPHTNTTTQSNQQRDKSVLVLVAYGLVIVAQDQSSWVDRNGSRCL